MPGLRDRLWAASSRGDKYGFEVPEPSEGVRNCCAELVREDGGSSSRSRASSSFIRAWRRLCSAICASRVSRYLWSAGQRTRPKNEDLGGRGRRWKGEQLLTLVEGFCCWCDRWSCRGPWRSRMGCTTEACHRTSGGAMVSIVVRRSHNTTQHRRQHQSEPRRRTKEQHTTRPRQQQRNGGDRPAWGVP